MLQRQKENETLNDYFYRLKKFARENGVKDDLVRDTLINNINIYGL